VGVRERVRVRVGGLEQGYIRRGGAAQCIWVVGSHPTADRGGLFIWAGG
jgi:hypothetical protein